MYDVMAHLGAGATQAKRVVPPTPSQFILHPKGVLVHEEALFSQRNFLDPPLS